MRLFLAENVGGLTHTFIRQDIQALRKSGALREIDISKYSAGTQKSLTNTIDLLRGSLRLVFTKPQVIARLMLCGRWKSNLHAILIATRIIKDFQIHSIAPCEIHTHFAAKAAVVGFLLSARFGSPHRIVCHGSDLYTLPRSMNFLLESAAQLETVTWFGKGFIFGRIGNRAIGKAQMRRNKIQKATNAQPHDQDQDQDQDRQRVFVCPGRLVPQKDIPFAIQVLSELRQHGIDSRLKIVGEGPCRREIESLVSSLDLKDYVELCGSLTNTQTLELISTADGLLLPCAESSVQNADGLPVVFQEALIFGVPVFCRSAFGVAELILNNVNGYAFTISDSPLIWAKKISSTMPLIRPELIARIAQAQVSE